jgi:hypothetical protein
MRRPQERLSQRRLVYELRRAIDRDRVDDVRRLAREHPLALRSAHVRHNLGSARVARLSHLVATDSFVG